MDFREVRLNKVVEWQVIAFCFPFVLILLVNNVNKEKCEFIHIYEHVIYIICASRRGPSSTVQPTTLLYISYTINHLINNLLQTCAGHQQSALDLHYHHPINNLLLTCAGHQQRRAQEQEEAMKQPLSYFVEKLNNVQCFQLYISTPSSLQADPPPPQIQVIKNTIHCVWGEYPFI